MLLPIPVTTKTIPRIIHQIWLGGNMPEQYQRWGDKIRALHPHWEYRLWTEDTPPPGFDHPAFLKSRNPAFISDIWRLLILLHLGGIYLDTDVECFRPLESLIDNCDALIGATVEGNIYKRILVENAVMASIPGHAFFRAVIDQLPEIIEHNMTNLTWSIIDMTGPGMLSREIVSYRRDPQSIRSDIAIIPSRLLYPNGRNADQYCIHHFKSTWINMPL